MTRSLWTHLVPALSLGFAVGCAADSASNVDQASEGAVPAAQHSNDAVHADAYGVAAQIQLSVGGTPLGVSVDPKPFATLDADGSEEQTLASLSASTNASGSTPAQLLLSTGAIDSSASVSRSAERAETHAQTIVATPNLPGILSADAIVVHADSANENEADGGTQITNLRIAGQLVDLPTNIPPNYKITVDANVPLNILGLPSVIPGSFTIILNEQHGGLPNGTVTDPVVQVIGAHVTGTASIAGLVQLSVDASIAEAAASTQRSFP